jgi:hypothetical protein
MDSAGNFYIASGPNYGTSFSNPTAAVYKLTNTGSGYTLSTLGSGWSSPSATAVDFLGNVWVSDYNAGVISLLIPSGGSYIQVVFAHIANMKALSVNKVGQLYGFQTGTANFWVGGAAPHYHGSYNVGASGPTVAVTVSFISATTITGYSVETGGATGADFTDAGSSTCIAGSYAANASCIINIVFKPKAVGLRSGALVIKGAGGVVLGANFVYGIGVGPVAAFSPAIISSYVGTGVTCSGTLSTCGDGGTSGSATLNNPSAVAFDWSGNLYIADTIDYAVRKVTPGGTITTIAGTGTACSSATTTCGDGGAASGATFTLPTGVAVDGAGNLYIVDAGANRIRKIDGSTGIITTIAGNGTTCSSPTAACGDGGLATSATFNMQGYGSAAVDQFGNLVIADYGDNRVRVISMVNGKIATVAGTGTACATATAVCGDGGQATSAQLNGPTGVGIDNTGDYLIADGNDNRVRVVNASTGIITTAAGTGSACSSASCGDGGAATSALLNFPRAAVEDSAGNIYIADSGDNSIRLVSASSSKISTVAGSTTACSTSTTACGDGGAARSAQLNNPSDVVFDTTGNLYIAEATNRIREVSLSSTLPINFLPTYPGSASSDSPHTVTLSDNGNAALVMAVPGTGNNPSIAAGFAYDGSSSCPQLSATSSAYSLAIATNCTYKVDFIPQANGQNTGSLVLTNNNLGTSATTQSIGLSGIGVAPVAALVFATPPASPIAVGGNAGSAVVVNEINSTGGVVILANDFITLTVSGPNGYSATYTSTAVAGVATFNLAGVTLASQGTYTYTAAEATFSVTATELTQDFTLAVSSGSGTASVFPGAKGSFTLAITPVGGSTFATAIFLTASGGPAGSTLTLTPSSIFAGAGVTSVILTVATLNTVAANKKENLGRKLAPFSLAVLLLPFAGRMRRTGKKLSRLLPLLLLLIAGLAATAGLSGCTGLNSGYFGQAPMTYTITVAGTSGTLVHSTSVTLTVQ